MSRAARRRESAVAEGEVAAARLVEVRAEHADLSAKTADARSGAQRAARAGDATKAAELDAAAASFALRLEAVGREVARLEQAVARADELVAGDGP